jgi:hypothetical protein
MKLRQLNSTTISADCALTYRQTRLQHEIKQLSVAPKSKFLQNDRNVGIWQKYAAREPKVNTNIT